MATVETILTYGFGADPGKAALANGRADLWWSKNAEADREIHQRFEASVQLAAAGKLNPWLAEPRGRRALILTDQFPRNIYRDSPLAFALDTKALAWSIDGIEKSQDHCYSPSRELSSICRWSIQNSWTIKSSRFAWWASWSLVAAEQREIFEHYLNVAILHRDIIARFGRFPHRNRVLDRSSTAEELYFLSQPASKF